MADNCITCERPVTSRQQGIQCDFCLKWNHGTCITGKLSFILHFHSVCKTPFDLWGDVRYFAARNRSVAYFFFHRNFSTRLSSRCTHSYRDRLGLHSLSVFFIQWPRVTEYLWLNASAEILESSESNPRSTQSDSFQSTIYNLPDSRKLPFLNVILIGARFSQR